MGRSRKYVYEVEVISRPLTKTLIATDGGEVSTGESEDVAAAEILFSHKLMATSPQAAREATILKLVKTPPTDGAFSLNEEDLASGQIQILVRRFDGEGDERPAEDLRCCRY